MNADENRPTGAASEAGGPGVIVRLSVDLRDVETTHGWPTFKGTRLAHRLLDEALAAPRGVEVVLRVGTIRPGLSISETVWRELLSKFAVTVEADRPTVAREWHEFTRAVLGGDDLV